MIKKHEHLLKKAPNISFSDPSIGLSSTSGAQRNSELPQKPDQEALSSEHKIHLRHSLKTGELHFHQKESFRIPSCHFFIDNSLSVQELLGKGQAEELAHYYERWLSRHHLHGKVLLACSENKHRKWNLELWDEWFSQQDKALNGVSLVISDFHGPLPSGKLWQCLTARSELMIFRLQHPEPQLGEGELFYDSEDLQKRKSLTWNQENFNELKAKWHSSLEAWLRKSSRHYASIHENHFEQLITKSMAALT
ncbi:MAG: hypothetical protein HQL32_11380 [Planctomycetes bacterium]|nr:hypothetical protein [Planctomycetota bacterium]